MLTRRLSFLLPAPLATGLCGVLVLQRHGVAGPRIVLMLGAIAACALVAAALATFGRERLARHAPALAIGALALIAASLFG